MLRSRRFWLSLLFVLFAIASLNAFAASRLRRWSVKSPFVVRHAAGAYLQRPAAPLWPLEQSKPEGHGTPAVALPTQPDPQSPDALSIGREAEVGGVPPLPFFADSTLSASVWHKLRPSLSYFKWLKEDPTPFNSWPGGRTGTTPARIHWKKLPERYPVPQKSLISLPSAQPRSLPRIQHAASSPETAADKKERERRKAAVKEAFVHSWKGYKAYAWLDDELLPVSGQSQSPFCGWAATLVDSLDTMWIMGMKAEFEHAVKALDKIDFTTSLAEEIPLFETTIRYFGGLLSAYDVSNAQYPILLRKAVELANVLLAAFDTPNRMPMTFYRWKPEFASRFHTAGSKTILAELGSLSVEFTRLAQITKESKYYDAVARITNEFEAWQNHTRLPGLFPAYVDASGCRRVRSGYEYGYSAVAPGSVEDGYRGYGDEALLEDVQPVASPARNSVGRVMEGEPSRNSVSWETQRAADQRKPILQAASLDTARLRPSKRRLRRYARETQCEPQGLASSPSRRREMFTLGALSDSTYEYFSKEYMLLGGVNDQYQRLYERAIDVAKEQLLFRPMLPDNRDILLSGNLLLSDRADERLFIAEGAHLSCFVGGMLAIAAQIFQRPADLATAAKLADGCVWAYEATRTGIMPESFVAVPCADAAHCRWNETRYMEAVYAFRAYGNLDAAYPQKDVPPPPTEQPPTQQQQQQQQQQRPEKDYVRRRQRRHAADAISVASRPLHATLPKSGLGALEAGSDDPLSPSSLYSPTQEPPTLEDYARGIIKEDRLPPGMVGIPMKGYALRPEAIESVFIMYRITGDEQWREKGWKMFKAISRHTRAKYGYSGILDVTSSRPVQSDQMQSFWTAETLKYFYLLFSEPDVVSLDEYVFNTEAHPMKRPIHAA